MLTRLDAFHWMHRFDAAVRTDYHPRTRYSSLSAAVFDNNKEDKGRLIAAIRAVGAQETFARVEFTINTLKGPAGMDDNQVHLFKGIEAIDNVWEAQQKYIECIQDPPDMPMYTITKYATVTSWHTKAEELAEKGHDAEMLNWTTRIVVPATHLPPHDVGDDPQGLRQDLDESDFLPNDDDVEAIQGAICAKTNGDLVIGDNASKTVVTVQVTGDGIGLIGTVAKCADYLMDCVNVLSVCIDAGGALYATINGDQGGLYKFEEEQWHRLVINGTTLCKHARKDLTQWDIMTSAADNEQLKGRFSSAIRGLLVSNFKAFSGVQHTVPGERWVSKTTYRPLELLDENESKTYFGQHPNIEQVCK
ncbi:Hypp9348 [Branchiostoma lanceolatum]|uniref:Hypp9348 protein n=1 Tax=Branchiostoma lanceolatum TaxID=7740 RepID=A0A8S4MLT5_BRALA|nr:Hypp9348 [Branchiostoma lanceolatum]